MAMVVYAAMEKLAKARGVCCDWSKKSFGDFWRRVGGTLFTRGDEDARVAAWKRLMVSRGWGNVNYGGADNPTAAGWGKYFRAAAAKVPYWYP